MSNTYKSGAAACSAIASANPAEHQEGDAVKHSVDLLGRLRAVVDLLVGTLLAPLRIDPVGTTAQPISTPKSSTVTSQAVTVGQSSVQALAANPNRKRALVVNTGASTLYVREGDTAASAETYTYPLAACGQANDGTGGRYESDLWTGAVQVFGTASGAACMVSEWE